MLQPNFNSFKAIRFDIWLSSAFFYRSIHCGGLCICLNIFKTFFQVSSDFFGWVGSIWSSRCNAEGWLTDLVQAKMFKRTIWARKAISIGFCYSLLPDANSQKKSQDAKRTFAEIKYFLSTAVALAVALDKVGFVLHLDARLLKIRINYEMVGIKNQKNALSLPGTEKSTRRSIDKTCRTPSSFCYAICQ